MPEQARSSGEISRELVKLAERVRVRLHLPAEMPEREVFETVFKRIEELDRRTVDNARRLVT